MTPEDHAIAWWGDQSYPKGEDWNALLHQFAVCRDEARNEVLDEVLGIVAELNLGDEAAQRLASLRAKGVGKRGR